MIEPITFKLFVKVLGWSEEKVAELVKDVLATLGSKGDRMYETVVVVWGRKPLPKSDAERLSQGESM